MSLDDIKAAADAQNALNQRISDYWDNLEADRTAYQDLSDTLVDDLEGRFTRIFYVDALAGDDANGVGSEALPFASIKKAADETVNGAAVTIFLRRGQEHLTIGEPQFTNNYVVLRGFGGEATNPVIIGQTFQDALGRDFIEEISLNNSTLECQNIDLKTGLAPSGNPNARRGLFNVSQGGQLRTFLCSVQIGDFTIVMGDRSTAHCSFVNTDISRNAAASVAANIATGGTLIVPAFGSSIPAAETWDDYLSITRDGGGAPMNIITNLPI